LYGIDSNSSIWWLFQECAERGRAGAVDHGGDVAADDVARSPTHRPSPEILANQLRLFPTGINFTNILQVTFLYKSYLRCFFSLTVFLCNFFGARILGQNLLVKPACKMLMKLTTGVNFTNIL